MAAFLANWKQITSDRVILETIAGYRLPLTQHPPPQLEDPPSHLSTLEEQICAQEIYRLLVKDAIEGVLDCENQFLSPFFVIKKSSGGWRFILNLKRLNKFIFAPHFKLEDWKTVIRLISPGDYLASVDLEDAYLLLPVHRDDRKFLRFRFQGQLYQFKALPFGLASAPYIFTKIMKPVLYSLRQQGSAQWSIWMIFCSSHTHITYA